MPLQKANLGLFAFILANTRRTSTHTFRHTVGRRATSILLREKVKSPPLLKMA